MASARTLLRSLRGGASGLTTRGRSFLAAGLAAAVTAVALGEPSVLRVGLLLAAIPVLGALAVTRSQYRLSCTRRVEPLRVAAGDSAVVTLRLDNVSRVRTGVLLAEDRVPYVLGSRPRFVLDRVESRGQRAVGYKVHSDLRGRFVLGPLGVRIGDPFGMCELQRSFTATDTLTVTPVVVPLSPLPLAGALAGNGSSTSRSLAAAGEDDVSTREYRHGDALHRVHWRSTARRGELMVRREEQPWQSRATILFDARARAHRGDGPQSSFERAVSAVASVGVHLSERGFAVRLVQLGAPEAQSSGAVHRRSGAGTLAGGVIADLPVRPEESRAALLDSLAVVTPVPGEQLLLQDLHRARSGDVLLIAVLAGLTPEEALALTSAPGVVGFRRGRLALVLDAPAWTSSAASGGGRPGASASGASPSGASPSGANVSGGSTAGAEASSPLGGSPVAGGAYEPSAATRAAVSVLLTAGWRVAVVGPQTPLASAWAALAPAGVPRLAPGASVAGGAA